MIGLAQGVLLMRAGVIKNAEAWLAVSTLGAAFLPVTMLVGRAILAIAVFGVMQWLLLRRYVPRAYWWIGANIIGGGLGLLIGTALADALVPDDPFGFAFHSARSADHWSVLWISAVFIYSLSTGLALVGLLRSNAAPVGGGPTQRGGPEIV